MTVDPLHSFRSVDVLAVGAHPDDVEINVGGTLLALRRSGRTSGVVDLSAGELGTRGTPEVRAAEASAAAAVLELAFRVNLGLPDGEISPDSDSREALIRCIRACRPRLVLTHSGFGHPDHFHARCLVEEAVHHSGLERIETAGQERFRPDKIAYWISFDQPETPDFVVDITTVYETKDKAIRAHESQLFGEGESETYLSRPGYLARLRSFHHHLGSLSGCDLAEGFRLSRLPRIPDLTRC